MTANFANGLERLNAMAAQYLKWPPDQFWAATPAELLFALADPDANPADPISRDEIEQLLERECDG